MMTLSYLRNSKTVMSAMNFNEFPAVEDAPIIRTGEVSKPFLYN